MLDISWLTTLELTEVSSMTITYFDLSNCFHSSCFKAFRTRNLVPMTGFLDRNLNFDDFTISLET